MTPDETPHSVEIYDVSPEEWADMTDDEREESLTTRHNATATLAQNEWVTFLLRRLNEERAARDHRVHELLDANTTEVNRRRELEARLADVEGMLACRDGMMLQTLRRALELTRHPHALERYLREAMGEKVDG